MEYDGKAPCPSEWIEELKKQSARRDEYSAERKNAVLAARNERRARRRQFRESFPDKMRITRTGPNRLRFQPLNRGDSFDCELTYDPRRSNSRNAENSLQFEDNEGLAR